MPANADNTDNRPIVKLVGLFRRLVDPEIGDDFSLGGYVDSFRETPYSLANAYLKAYCDSLEAVKGVFRIELVDFLDRRRPDAGEEVRLRSEDIQALAEDRPAAVCFSTYCWNLDAAVDGCTQLKTLLPAVKTVLGGRAVEGTSRLILEKNSSVDFTVSGEGERPFSLLLESGFAPPAPFPGLAFRDRDGSVVTKEPAEPVLNLDEIPSPYLTGAVRPSAEGMLMELSRGCLNNCGYCAWNSSKLRRHFSRERLQQELKWAVTNGVRHITLVDSAVNYETEKLADFVSALKAADPGRTLSFTYNLRHEFVNEAQTALLMNVPSRQVLLGMESLTEIALDSANRARFSTGGFQRALEQVAAITPPVVGVVLGLPGDTPAGFRATMEYLGNLNRSGPQPVVGAILVSLLQVFPGTGLSGTASEMSIKVKEPGIPYVIANSTFSLEDLRECVRQLQILRIKYPVLVKGPEGLSALVKPEGDDLLADFLYRLVAPWARNQAMGEWKLEDARPIPDGEGIGFFTFAHPVSSARIKVRLDRKNVDKPCFTSTEYFNIYYLGDLPEHVSRGTVDALMNLVADHIRENERSVVERAP